MVERNDAGEVRAAGGVVCRDAGGRLEVLLVHRAHYDDWSIPKGKVEEGEDDESCAEREVEEETGLRVRRLDELPSVRWIDRFGRPKVARYWRMEPVPADARAHPQHEVDEVAWLPIEEAIGRLTYERDAVVLEALLPPDQTLPR
jgi:8-oxo-dGTP pyrophosphatase MutT (NUDIX family)